MRQKRLGKINSWKWLFLSLLALVFGVLLVLFTRIQSPREDFTSLIQVSQSDTKVGTFSTNRDQLNQSIANYLEEYQTDDFKYQLFVTSQQVVFEGSYQIFGVSIPLYLYFQPHKLEDGSILLSINEISAGTLSLPKGEVLAYIQKNYKLPSFVKIDSEEAQIQLQITELENSLGLYGKANTIDLYNDEIIVDIPKFQVEVSHPKEIHLATCSPSIF